MAIGAVFAVAVDGATAGSGEVVLDAAVTGATAALAVGVARTGVEDGPITLLACGGAAGVAAVVKAALGAVVAGTAAVDAGTGAFAAAAFAAFALLCAASNASIPIGVPTFIGSSSDPASPRFRFRPAIPANIQAGILFWAGPLVPGAFGDLGDKTVEVEAVVPVDLLGLALAFPLTGFGSGGGFAGFLRA